MYVDGAVALGNVTTVSCRHMQILSAVIVESGLSSAPPCL